MNEEQQKKFEEWCANYSFSAMTSVEHHCFSAWEACLEANEVEDQELERASSIAELADEMSGSFQEPNWKWMDVLAWLLSRGMQFPKEQEPEPTPTEMARKLLDKGWELKPGRDLHDLCLEDPKTRILYDFNDKSIEKAYRKAFPRKKKVEVEVWMDGNGGIRTTANPHCASALGFTRGTATFWVEDSDEG